MTRKQLELLDIIGRFIAEHRHSPSYAELAVLVGLASKSGIHARVSALARDGYISRRVWGVRSIELTGKGREACGFAAKS